MPSPSPWLTSVAPWMPVGPVAYLRLVAALRRWEPGYGAAGGRGNRRRDRGGLRPESATGSKNHWIGFLGKIYRKPWFLPSNWSGFPVKIFPSSNSMKKRVRWRLGISRGYRLRNTSTTLSQLIGWIILQQLGFHMGSPPTSNTVAISCSEGPLPSSTYRDTLNIL